ncbi:thioesterase family protein [Thermobifida cellulosilytica]|nr:thioesterase family protein [Thermobifida cellulosilytica]
MTRFDSATAVVRVGENRYAAELDPGYLIGAAINGGYLMALLQRAVLAESDHAHAVSSSYHFHRPGSGGPAEIETEVVKRGRTVTTVQATLRQSGRTVLTGTVATATLDSQAQPIYTAPRPEIPPIEQCRSFDPRSSHLADDGFLARVDVGFAPDSYAALLREHTVDTPELLGYVDLSARDGGPAEDPAAFVPLAVDALPPIVSLLTDWSWAPTVELTWHLRAVPEPGPLAFRVHSSLVSDGWFDENVELWDVKGRLVAQSRQLARVGR